jgi:hypothetical protein
VQLQSCQAYACAISLLDLEGLNEYGGIVLSRRLSVLGLVPLFSCVSLFMTLRCGLNRPIYAANTLVDLATAASSLQAKPLDIKITITPSCVDICTRPQYTGPKGPSAAHLPRTRAGWK